MEENKKNEELQSRRGFFKNAAKKALHLLMLSFIFTAMASYAQNWDYQDLKVEKDGYEWCLLTTNGEKRKIRWAQDKDGMILVPIDKGYEWVSYENGFLCGTIFDNSDPENLKTKSGFYSKKGIEVISPTKYDEAYLSGGEDGEPLWFHVKKKDKYGACDINGNEIVKPKYYGLLYNSDGFEGKKSKDGKYETLNIKLSGHNEFELADKKLQKEEDGFEWYKLDNYPDYGVADKDGNILLSLEMKLTSVKYLPSKRVGGRGVFEVEKDDCIGLYNSNGVEILSPNKRYTKWRYIGDSKCGFFCVSRGKYRYGICNLNQEEIIAPGKYSSVEYLTEGFLKVEKGDFEGICNLMGTEIISPNRFSRVYIQGGGGKPLWIEVCDNDLYGAFDISGRELVPAKYSILLYNNETGFYGTSVNGEDVELNVTIKDSYDEVVEESAQSSVEPELESKPSTIQKVMNITSAIANFLSCFGSNNTYDTYQSNGTHMQSSDAHYKTKATRKCTHCAGTGECKTCRGKGYILGKVSQEYRPCPSCNPGGTASVDKKGKCTFCNGTGTK